MSHICDMKIYNKIEIHTIKTNLILHRVAR